MRYARIPLPLFTKLLKYIPDPKKLLQDDTRLDEFCQQYVADEAAKTPFAEFYADFQTWLAPSERKAWSKIRVSRMLPFPSKNGRGNVKLILAREVTQ